MTAKYGFADRLAYIRWLRSRGRRAAETDREFAAAIGVTYGWFTKWKVRLDAPPGRTEARAILAALRPSGVTEEWLFDAKGKPPEHELWDVWVKGPVVVAGALLPDPRQQAKERSESQGRPASGRSGRKKATG